MSDLHRTSEWMKFIYKARPIIHQTLPAPCVQPHCPMGGIVYPDQQWDVAHLPGFDAALNKGAPLDLALVGPAHRKCNRSDGGRLGAKIQQQNRQKDTGRTRYPAW